MILVSGSVQIGPGCRVKSGGPSISVTVLNAQSVSTKTAVHIYLVIPIDHMCRFEVAHRVIGFRGVTGTCIRLVA